MALTPIQQVRLLVQDNTPGLYILADEEVQFLIDKNNSNIGRTSLDAAKIILFNLAQRPDEKIDVFSISGKTAAEQYRLALELYIRDPNNNPILQNLQGYFGGISLSDMEANDSNLDNNIVDRPTKHKFPYFTGPFTVDPRYF